MRRNKQALCQEECEQVLRRATSGVLSLISLDGFPYGVPLSYALVDGVIVFHGALEGQKIDCIRRRSGIYAVCQPPVPDGADAGANHGQNGAGTHAAEGAGAMNVDDYQQEAMSLLNPALNPQDVLENALMGLCGESGEAIDLLKKHRFQGHPLDKEKLKKELGDVAWYLAEAAQGLNVPLSEILQGNLNKLHGRYPNGFSSERSMHRENAE